MEIASLEPGDDRRSTVGVAGPGALLVAKAHKLGERLRTPERLQAKDAGDVYRLFDATPPTAMAPILTRLLRDERSSRATQVALGFIEQLFSTSASTGTRLAAQALRGTLPEPTVAATMLGYVPAVLELIARDDEPAG